MKKLLLTLIAIGSLAITSCNKIDQDFYHIVETTIRITHLDHRVDTLTIIKDIPKCYNCIEFTLSGEEGTLGITNSRLHESWDRVALGVESFSMIDCKIIKEE